MKNAIHWNFCSNCRMTGVSGSSSEQAERCFWLACRITPRVSRKTILFLQQKYKKDLKVVGQQSKTFWSIKQNFLVNREKFGQ